MSILVYTYICIRPPIVAKKEGRHTHTHTHTKDPNVNVRGGLFLSIHKYVCVCIRIENNQNERRSVNRHTPRTYVCIDKMNSNDDQNNDMIRYTHIYIYA